MKSQVTMEYDDQTDKILIKKVLMSIQHDENFNETKFKKFVKENIIDFVAKENNSLKEVSYELNEVAKVINVFDKSSFYVNSFILLENGKISKLDEKTIKNYICLLIYNKSATLSV